MQNTLIVWIPLISSLSTMAFVRNMILHLQSDIRETLEFEIWRAAGMAAPLKRSWSNGICSALSWKVTFTTVSSLGLSHRPRERLVPAVKLSFVYVNYKHTGIHIILFQFLFKNHFWCINLHTGRCLNCTKMSNFWAWKEWTLQYIWEMEGIHVFLHVKKGKILLENKMKTSLPRCSVK